MRSVVAWCACLIACASPTPDDDTDSTSDGDGSDTDPSAADPCEALTWETVGAPFVWTWCTPCHGADLTGDDRQGAPREVLLDTEAEVLEQAGLVRAVALGSSPVMPPSGGPDAAELARVAAWLKCEAP